MNQCKQLFQFEFESKPLNKCFHLRMASKQVYDWLNEYSVRIDGSYQKLFDLLLESASTDIIMSILQRYEIRYWNTKKYYEEKTSSLRSYLIWLNNGDVGQTAALIKDIPREYYCLGENGNNNIYLYSSLEKEFLQILIFLRKYHVKYTNFSCFLHPSSFVALIDKHPCFAYCLEKYWNFYSEYRKETNEYNFYKWQTWIYDRYVPDANPRKQAELNHRKEIFESLKMQIRNDQKYVFKVKQDPLDEEKYYQHQLAKQIRSTDFDKFRRVLRQYDEEKIKKFSEDLQEDIAILRTENKGINLIKDISKLLKLDISGKEIYTDTYRLPYQLANSPCFRMFCKKVQTDIWEKKQSSTPLEKYKDLDFYLGLSVLAKMVSDQISYFESQIETYIDIPDLTTENDRPVELIWPWAEQLMRNNETMEAQRTDFSGENIPFLSKLMNWFYDRDCLSDWINTCRWVKYKHGHDDLATLTVDLQRSITSLEDINFGFSLLQESLSLTLRNLTVDFTTELKKTQHSNGQSNRNLSGNIFYDNLDKLDNKFKKIAYALADTSDAVRSQLKEIKKTEEKYFNQINYIRRLLHSICVEKSDEEKANYSKQEDSSSQPFDLQDINERLYNFLLLLPEWYLSDLTKLEDAVVYEDFDQIIEHGSQFWKDLQHANPDEYDALRTKYDRFLSANFGLKNKIKQRTLN